MSIKKEILRNAYFESTRIVFKFKSCKACPLRETVGKGFKVCSLVSDDHRIDETSDDFPIWCPLKLSGGYEDYEKVVEELRRRLEGVAIYCNWRKVEISNISEMVVTFKSEEAPVEVDIKLMYSNGIWIPFVKTKLNLFPDISLDEAKAQIEIAESFVERVKYFVPSVSWW